MLPFLPVRGTGYDLRFSLGGVPVTISPFFWVTAALLGWTWLDVEPGGPANLIVWVLCVLVSILLHEFGHALAMKYFGHQPEVVLHHFGGYATYRGRRQETYWHSLLISAAGPAIQFVFFFLIIAGSLAMIEQDLNWAAILTPEELVGGGSIVPVLMVRTGVVEFGSPQFAAVSSLLFVNFYWPLLNLLPVLPLDGGRILWAILGLAKIEEPGDWAVKVSVGIGIVAAAYFLLGGRFIAGAMFAFMAMENYRSLQKERFSPL